MNFIERQGMVRFEAFPNQCMMHEILLKIHWMPEFFFTKKIVGGKSVVSYSPVFFHQQMFSWIPFQLEQNQRNQVQKLLFLFRFDWTEARITIHMLNISVPQQHCIKFTFDDTVFIILLLFFWFVCFSFSTLNTLISVCTFSKLFSMCF